MHGFVRGRGLARVSGVATSQPRKSHPRGRQRERDRGEEGGEERESIHGGLIPDGFHLIHTSARAEVPAFLTTGTL